MTDNEKLIEEAAQAIQNLIWTKPFGHMITNEEAARAVLAVFEKARTPTDDEREALAMQDALDWAKEYDAAPVYVSRAFMRGIDAAGFRRSEVPEPSANEDVFAPGECDGSGTCPARRHIHGCYTRHRADQCDSPDEYGHIEASAIAEHVCCDCGIPDCHCTGCPGCNFCQVCALRAAGGVSDG